MPHSPYGPPRPTAQTSVGATGLELRIPAGLLPTTPTVAPLPREPVDPDAMIVSTGLADAVEVDRVVPASGNLMVAQQQIWRGPTRAGLPVVVWVDTERLHVLGVDGGRIKTTASRLSQRDLARLRNEGGRAAGDAGLLRIDILNVGDDADIWSMSRSGVPMWAVVDGWSGG